MELRVIVGVVTILGIFLAVREFWWWYWGIGRMVAALEDIAISLRTLPTVAAHDQRTKRRPPRAA